MIKCNQCEHFAVRVTTYITSAPSGEGTCRRYAPRPSMSAEAAVWPPVPGHLPLCGDGKRRAPESSCECA